ncbi:MAG: amidohydrolase [Candidatus Kariarchaeaceae archaeon]|jgi:5-methylthioadenosine/S-adenosylhomocysteine deaminase
MIYGLHKELMKHNKNSKTMTELSIQAKWLYRPDGKIIQDAHVVIEDKKIVYAGKIDQKQIPNGTDRIDIPKGFIVPPFINAHTHLPETLIRGICDDKDLNEWLWNNVWQLEPKMEHSDARVAAQLGIAEMISSGTIGFIDQFYFSDQIAEVVKETGVKALLCPSIFDRSKWNVSKNIEEAFHENMRVIKKWHKNDNRIFVGFGPHAPYTVSDELYLRIHEEAVRYDTKIHTHLNETRGEVKESLAKFNLTPIEKMEKIGVLDRIIAAHCIHLSDNDKRLLQKYPVPVLHCIQSNLKIAAGIAEIPELLKLEIPVCLGTDGSASNNNLEMLEEVRLTALIHKGVHNDPTLVDAETALKLGTSNASVLFPKNVFTGRIESNNPADLLVVDLDRVNTTPIIHPLSNWVFSGNTSNVALSISNGKILFDRGKFTTIDIEKVKDNAQNSTNSMIERAENDPVVWN